MITSIGSQSETINPHFLLCWLGRCCEMLFLGRRLQPLSTFGAISGCNPLEIQLLNFDCRVDCCFVSRTVLSTLSGMAREMSTNCWKKVKSLAHRCRISHGVAVSEQNGGKCVNKRILVPFIGTKFICRFPRKKKRNKHLGVIVVTEIPLVCSTELGTRPLDGVGRRLFFLTNGSGPER